MPTVYILQSSINGKFYVGSSHEDSSISRVNEHNAGRVRSTCSGKPWILKHEEHFETYTEARKRENFLKMGVGRKWIYEKFKY